MAKYYGMIGYANTEESRPGVFIENIVEHPYYGEVLQNTRRLANGESVNDNVTISNIISVLADPYALNNFFNIRYVTWMGAKFKITNIEVNYPRLKLTVGGLYNGEEA